MTIRIKRDIIRRTCNTVHLSEVKLNFCENNIYGAVNNRDVWWSP